MLGEHRKLSLGPIGAVEFERVPVNALSSAGTPYTRWVPFGMPKLGQYQFLLDVVFFLYPDEASAKAGVKAGGTGFFVGIPSANYPDHYHHIYAVTNWHVAVDGSPVIRINSKAGPPEVIPFEPHEWFFIPKGPDIAVIPIDGLRTDLHKVDVITFDSFALSPEEVTKQEINAGEDVFMLGRFLDYDGIEANTPSMRFGNISMMAAKVMQPTGYGGSSIVADMHSRTGFSGSPVFVYRTAGSVFAKEGTIMGGGHMMRLLGILWGQFPEEWDIGDKAKRAGSQAAHIPVLDGKAIRGMSGMSLLCPAWEIKKVLDMPELKKQRKTVEDELAKRVGSAPVKQSATAPSEPANANHREDFKRLLDAAVKSPKSSG